MIRIGACTDPSNAAMLAECGFAYIEVNFQRFALMSEEEYASQLSVLRAAPIKAEAANGMVPGSLKVTGPDADEKKLREYAKKGFARAAEMGVQTVVFGSGAARAVPEGFPYDEALRQIASWLRIASDEAEPYGITTVIEPLRPKECNILNLVSESLVLASLVDRKNICVLADSFHMEQSGEPLCHLAQAGSMLRHVHISHSLGASGRIWPAAEDFDEMRAFFQALHKAGYDGRVSIEAGCDDLPGKAAAAFRVLRGARDQRV